MTCHLAAHEENVIARNDDIKEIMKRLKFGKQDSMVDVSGTNDYLFFYGDLNYRIDLPFHHVISILSDPNCQFNEMLEKDQLLNQLKGILIFFSFFYSIFPLNNC